MSAAVDVPSGLGTLLLVSAGRLVRYDVRTGVTQPIPMPVGQLAVRAWPLPGADVVLTWPAPARPITDTPSLPTQSSPATPVGPGSGGDPSRSTPSTSNPSVPLGTAAPGPVLPRPGSTAHPRGGGTGSESGSGALATSPATSVYAIPHRGEPIRLGAATAVVPSTDGDHVWLLHDDVARLVGLDGRATPTWVRVPPGYRLVGLTPRGPIVTVGGADPLTALLPANGGLPQWLADAEALDVANGMLLVHDDHRVGSLRLSTGAVHWLPRLSAVEITGPGALSPGSGSFAVQARVNEHARLVVGQIDAVSGGELRVVALEGGSALDHPSVPVWTEDGRVLVVRPDGRIVVYRPGDLTASVLGARYQASSVTAVGPDDRDLPR